jgi:hypothetical protein
MSYRDKLKDIILEQIKRIDFSKPDWNKEILEWRDQSTKTDIIWFLKEFVEKGEYIREALEIADLYSKDENPTPEYDNLNEKVLRGEETNIIYTVRGTVPWLLQMIIATLKTEYYPRILDITERLANDKVFYVRQQAMVALSMFAANVRAKKNKDGTYFNFRDEDRARVYDLSFKILRENRDLPRVLESISNVFDKLRFINEEQAKEMLTILCYDSKGNIHPEYLTSHVVPLALFFAEFRKKFDTNFNDEWFKLFLEQYIKDSKDPHLKSTLIWHTWRIIEDDLSDYNRVKRYIPLFFNNFADHEPVGQFEFLINAVLKASPSEGVQLYEKFLTELNYKLPFIKDFKFYFTHTEEIFGQIKKIDTSKLKSILSLLKQLRLQGCYIGDENIIFAPEIEA